MKTKTKTVAEQIIQFSPCHDALEWAGKYRDPAEAWAKCVRGDWMLWLLGKLSGPQESDGRRKLVLCTSDCAALALKYTKDARVKECIDTARRWAKDESSLAELRKAMTAADAADAAAAAADAAAYAAAAASYASYAASYAAAAAADASYASYAASYAAAAAAYAYARTKILSECADIVRRHYPEPPEVSAPV